MATVTTAGTASTAGSGAPTRKSDPLLQPLRIKHLTLRNRVMSTSHAAGIDEGGLPTERYQRYHEEKAKGGLALTMFGGSSMVDVDSSWGGGQLNVATDEIIPYFQSFSERVHRHGRVDLIAARGGVHPEFVALRLSAAAVALGVDAPPAPVLPLAPFPRRALPSIGPQRSGLPEPSP